MKMIDSYIMTWRKTFDIKSRASRYEYWAYFFLNCIISFLLLGLVLYSRAFTTFAFVILFISMIPTITLAVRRFHDINLSGFWIFGYFTINFLAEYSYILTICSYIVTIIVLFLSLKKGNVEANKYGNPIDDMGWKKFFVFLIWICLTPMIIGGYMGYKESMKKYRDNQAVVIENKVAAEAEVGAEAEAELELEVETEAKIEAGAVVEAEAEAEVGAEAEAEAELEVETEAEIEAGAELEVETETEAEAEAEAGALVEAEVKAETEVKAED